GAGGGGGGGAAGPPRRARRRRPRRSARRRSAHERAARRRRGRPRRSCSPDTPGARRPAPAAPSRRRQASSARGRSIAQRAASGSRRAAEAENAELTQRSPKSSDRRGHATPAGAVGSGEVLQLRCRIHRRRLRAPLLFCGLRSRSSPRPLLPLRTTRSLLFVARRGEHAFVGRGLDVAPAPVHPEPEARIASYVHLEYVGASLREITERVAVAGGPRIDPVLVHHPEPPA